MMTSKLADLITALVGVLNAPATSRAPALYPLARMKYPQRELNPQVHSDGTISVTLALYGWEYKHRGPRPRSPVSLNLPAIQEAIQKGLPSGLAVIGIKNYGTKIEIFLQEE